MKGNTRKGMEIKIKWDDSGTHREREVLNYAAQQAYGETVEGKCHTMQPAASKAFQKIVEDKWGPSGGRVED